MAEFKFHYFAGYGRGESLRMLLAHANVQYEYCPYDLMTEWRNVPEQLAEGFRRGDARVDPREKKSVPDLSSNRFL